MEPKRFPAHPAPFGRSGKLRYDVLSLMLLGRHQDGRPRTPRSAPRPATDTTARHDARSPTAATFSPPVISGDHHRPSRRNMTRSPARCPAHAVQRRREDPHAPHHRWRIPRTSPRPRRVAPDRSSWLRCTWTQSSTTATAARIGEGRIIVTSPCCDHRESSRYRYWYRGTSRSWRSTGWPLAVSVTSMLPRVALE